MDILAHALYGATLFSRSGVAGGRSIPAGTTNSFFRDWTVWVAAGLSVMPDLASIGATFAYMMICGRAPSFHGLPPMVFNLYHLTHSLVIAGLVLGVVYVFSRRWVVPALAWPLHVIMDSVAHGEGRWQTLLLYPISGAHYHGVNWWENPVVITVYWGVLPVIWCGLFLWRRAGSSVR